MVRVKAPGDEGGCRLAGVGGGGRELLSCRANHLEGRLAPRPWKIPTSGATVGNSFTEYLLSASAVPGSEVRTVILKGQDSNACSSSHLLCHQGIVTPFLLPLTKWLLLCGQHGATGLYTLLFHLHSSFVRRYVLIPAL